MDCLNCGTGMSGAREVVPYDVGLPYEIRLDDVLVHRCPSCGEFEIAIPRVEALHRAIALEVARRPGRLSGLEIRFLRKSLGWTGREAAAHLQVRPETLSRWETGARPMGEQSELLLRMSVELGERAETYRLESDTQPPPVLSMARGDKGWGSAA